MRSGTIWVVLATALAALLLLALLPQGVFWITDCAAKYLTTINLQSKGFSDFSIDYPGRIFDPDFTAKPIPDYLSVVRDGKLYSYYPPLFPLLCAPFHAALGFAGLYVVPFLGGLLCLWLSIRIAREYGLSGGRSLLYGLAVFWCTPCFFYLFCNWEHTLANAAVLGAMYLLIRHLREGSSKPLFWSGTILGLSVGLREEFYLLFAAILLSLLLVKAFRSRKLALFPAGTVAGLLPIWLFQYWAIGRAFGFHVSGNLLSSEAFQAGGLEKVLLERLEVSGDLLANISPDETITFFYALCALALVFAALASRKCTMLNALLISFLSILLAASTLMVFLFSGDTFRAWFQGDGLLMHGALLIPGFAAFVHARRTAAGHMARLFRYSALLFVLFLCATAPPLTSTGFHWGPRLMLPVFPLLLLPTFGFFSFRPAGAERLLPVSLALLLTAGLITQAYSFGVMKDKLETSARIRDQVLSMPEEVVVSDIWWFPQDMAGAFYEKTFLLSREDKILNRLVEAMKAEGVESYLYVAWHRGEDGALWSSDADLPLFDVSIFRREIR